MRTATYHTDTDTDKLFSKIDNLSILAIVQYTPLTGLRGAGAVVKAACWESRRSRARTPLWPSSFQEEKFSLAKIKYCGEPQ